MKKHPPTFRTISLVIPVRDEADNLPRLIRELETTLSEIEQSYEVVFVDDGSTDGSGAILQELAAANPAIRVLILDGSHGKTAALDAGFKHACGDVLILMDADCQNDPADLPLMLEVMERYDIVCGVRSERMDSPFRRFQSWAANGVRRGLTGDGVIDSGCGFQAVRRSALANIKLYDGMHRFLPCLVQMEGGRLGQVTVNHRPRTHGRSKYSIWNRGLRTVLDLFAVRWMMQRRIAYVIRTRPTPRPEDSPPAGPRS